MKTKVLKYDLVGRSQVFIVSLLALLRETGLAGSELSDEIPADVLETLKIKLVSPGSTGAQLLTTKQSRPSHYSVSGNKLTITLGELAPGDHRLSVVSVYGTSTRSLLIIDATVPVEFGTPSDPIDVNVAAISTVVDGFVPREGGEPGDMLQLGPDGKPTWNTPAEGTTLDPQPIEGSNNGVKSGGVFTAIKGLRNDAVLKKLGVNLFDQSAVTDNKYLASDGTLVSGPNYETSDYIPVTAGGSYYLSDTASALSSSTYVCFYDASKAFVSSVKSANSIAMAITIPLGCAYVRFSLLKPNIRKPQFEFGNARTKYFPYSIIGGYAPQIAKETVYSESITPGAITYDKIVDKAVGIKQTSIVSSVNMLDKEDADVAMGKYVAHIDGILRNNADYNTSGFIGVFPGKTYYFGSFGNIVSPRFYALYDNTKVFVTGGNYVSSITIPAGCYYIRFSLTTTQWGNESAQMTLGSVLPYSTYKVVLDPSIGLGVLVKKYDSALGNAAHTLTKAALLDGETLTDSVFPRFQLKGLVMSMACKISTMGTLIIGKGYQQRLGQYLRITSSTVEFIRCNLEGTESVRDTATHGLTIADFLRVSMYYIGNGYLRYIISTSSGYFQKDVNWSYYGEYEPFVKSTGTSASDVKLSIGSRDLKKPIWCFGDSYQSVSDNRWPGVLRNIGCFEFMINALTGINSVNALADAVRAFSFGTPKLAFWALGMNDASDTDASTPNENWLTSIQSFIDLCKANDTEPILATIPCVPAKNHEGKNAWVRASGYRYIDIADAVGGTVFTSGVDTWYSGMLSEDEVHPTELGAQAMASIVLADLPEIMQQNNDIDYVS